MKLANAQKLVSAARGKASEIGKPVSIAVVDASGCLVYFERDDGAPPQTAVIAEGKAASSALSGRNSSQLTTMAGNPVVMGLIASRLGNRFMPAQGGIVLKDGDNMIVGAIATSGATGEEDEQISEAGAAAHGK